MSACSNYALAGLASACKNSLGGIKKIYISDKRDEFVAGDNLEIEDGVITPKTAMNATDWKVYNVRKATSSATTNLVTSESAGNSWSTELTMQLFKMDAAKRAEVMALSEIDTLCAIFVDGNNNAWFIGKDYSIEMSAGTAQTGTAMTDLNGYNVTMKDDSVEIPYQIASEWITL